MGFRDWLLNEDGFAGAGGNSWDVIYPTYADDYAHVSAAPLNHFWLQFRWGRGAELGREFHNIDDKEFLQRGYVGLESRDMPSGGEGGWKHKADNGEGSVKPYDLPDLVWLADGETSEKTKALDRSATYRVWSNAGSTGYEPDCNLCKIFGDNASGKWPDTDPDYMDAEWTKKYESYMGEYGPQS